VGEPKEGKYEFTKRKTEKKKRGVRNRRKGMGRRNARERSCNDPSRKRKKAGDGEKMQYDPLGVKRQEKNSQFAGGKAKVKRK